jgi:hypothetical protein
MPPQLKICVDNSRLHHRHRFNIQASPALEEVHMGEFRNVILYSPNEQKEASSNTSLNDHTKASRIYVATKVADILGCTYAGEFNADDCRVDNSTAESPRAGSSYFIPVDTLMTSEARQLGIQSGHQLLGGYVAYPFMATKSITHPLIGTEADAPPGWKDEFPIAVGTAVLDGYTVFSRADARVAAERLLLNNSVRLKRSLGIGGHGQQLIRHIGQLDAALEKIDTLELERYGAVLEQHLDAVETFSIGQVTLAGITIAYYGTQYLTDDHSGTAVYGGSTLHVLRGDLLALRERRLPPALRIAVAQACRYNEAADEHLHLIASRRNYDVAQGFDRNRLRRSGVLEQSWRVGGATPAELAAIEAMLKDSQLNEMSVSTRERYDLNDPPQHATIYFRGEDAEVGALIKYCTIDGYGHFSE